MPLHSQQYCLYPDKTPNYLAGRLSYPESPVSDIHLDNIFATNQKTTSGVSPYKMTCGAPLLHNMSYPLDSLPSCSSKHYFASSRNVFSSQPSTEAASVQVPYFAFAHCAMALQNCLIRSFRDPCPKPLNSDARNESREFHSFNA